MDEGDYCAGLLKEKPVDFWDVRRENSETSQLRAWNGSLKDCTSSIRKTISVRVFSKGSMGFSYSDDFNTDALRKMVENAVRMAEVLGRSASEKKEIWRGKAVKANVKSAAKKNPSDITIEEKKQLLLSQTSKEKAVQSQQYQYTDQVRRMAYQNSEGSDIRQQLTYTHLSASVTMKHATKDRVETFDTREAGLAGFEIANRLAGKAKEAIEGARLLLRAKTIKGGMMPVVANSELTDVFVHEAVGHAAEADIVMQKDSYLEGNVGKKIAPGFVTIVDSGLGGHWGSFFYDDEGIRSQKTEIIKNGIVKSYLHSRETAAHFNALPTGNGRSQDAKKAPLVRMRWTYIEPGKMKEQELIEQVKNGVYLAGSKGGQVSTSQGSFQFSAQYGYEIRNGKLGDSVREVSIGGIAREILKSIKASSKDMPGIFPGYCGKGGQLVPVGGPCPSLLIGKALVGGEK